MAETTLAAFALTKLADHAERDLFDRYENQLSYAFPRLHFVGLRSAIPAGNKDLSLVVGVDKAGEIAQHQAVPVPEAGPRQKDGSQPGIAYVNSDPCRYQDRLPRFNAYRCIDAGAHVQARRSVSCIVRQGNGIAHSRIQNLQLD